MRKSHWKFVASSIVLAAAMCHGIINFDEDNCAACKITTATILEKFGYPAEVHTVRTIDGYNLTLFRIPYGIKSSKDAGKMPVIVQHGANANSDCWVNTYGSSDSLVTRLADHNYDVWLTNVRGNRYARHDKYSVKDFNYWNFTLDDMGLKDLKTNIDYVLKETKQPALAYIGHSMGAMTLTFLLSERPEYNRKVSYASLVSPVVFGGKNKHLIINFVAGNKPIIDPFKLKIFEFLVDNGLIKSLFATSMASSQFATKICETPKYYKLCSALMGSLVGKDPHGLPDVDSNLEIFFNGLGEGYPTKAIVHYAQMCLKNGIQKFDYHNKNFEVYGSSTPPSYNLSNIRIPMQIYCPRYDYLLDVEDCLEIEVRFKNAQVSKYIIEDEDISHFAFLYGNQRAKVLDVLLEDFENFYHEKGQKNNLIVISK